MVKEKIHIAMVGKDLDNVVNGFVSIGGKELYPIVSEQFEGTAWTELRQKMSNIKIHETFAGHKLIINPFKEDSFLRIVELIIEIHKHLRNTDCEVWINITGGTNLMSAAAEAAAVLTNSSAYYVVKGMDNAPQTVITLPWHSMNPKELDEENLSILNELMKLPSGKGMSNDSLIEELCRKRGTTKNMSSKTMSKRLSKLARAGYITQERIGRENINEITAWGKVATLLNGR
jgi:DNA-binding transcriptional ArsR family regulator